jgi:hypothetical protein
MNNNNLKNEIQSWISLDDQIKSLNEKTRELREKRNSLENKIANYANSNNLLNSIIQINNEKLKITNTKVAEPLTFKYLEKTLNEVIQNDTHIKKIMEHLKEKRIIKIVPEIKRYSNN